MGIFTYKTDEVLMEAYYGKKSEFAKIEKLLEVIIERCYNIKDGNSDVVINGSKELNEIEGLFEKAFGMGEMHLTFYTFSALMGAANAMPNACTSPTFLTFFKTKRNGKESLDKNMVCNVWVDTKLVTGFNLTPGELMAVILHEVGHCYNASLFALLSKIPLGLEMHVNMQREYSVKLNMSATIQNMITVLMRDVFKVSTITHKLDKAIQQLIEKNSKLATFVNNTLNVIANFMQGANMFNFRFHKQFNIIGLFRSLEPSSLFGYSDEKFADSFATAYGYGKEVISSQYKLQQGQDLFVNNVAKKIPILNIGLDFIQATNQLSILPVDPHPNSAIRMQSQINKLKRDLKDPNLDPRIRKELMNNLDEMERYLNDVVLDPEKNLKEGRLFTLIYNNIIMKLFKGKSDIREIFEIVYNHEM